MVSVIIPNYNHAPFLKERIDSVLNQTYDNFEVIILDDKSTDNSKEVIEVYRSHPRISQIVYNEENSGSTFKQWQKGFSLAKGDYIWIAESDDVAHPDFLKRLMSGIESNPNVVLAFSNLKMIDRNGTPLATRHLSSYMPKPMVDGNYFIRHNMLFGCNILNASSAVFSRSAALSVPKEFMNYRGAGDYLFWIELARQGNVFKESGELDYFRQHNLKVTPKSVSSGNQFKETNRIFHRLDELGFINHYNRQIVAAFWLIRLDTERDNIYSQEIYNECKSIWIKELRQPLFAKVQYYINGLLRLIKKNYLGYAR